MISTCLFDLGGVAVEVETDRMLHQLSLLTRVPLEEVERAVYDADWLLPLELGRITPEAYYGRLQQVLKVPWSFEQFVRNWNDTLREYRPVVSLMEQLRRRHQVIALTNTNVLHWRHMRSQFTSLGAVFHDWVASCDVGLRKPDPEIYRFALSRTMARPEETVYVDDRPEMVEAGRSVGLRAIRYESSRQLEDALRAAGATL